METQETALTGQEEPKASGHQQHTSSPVSKTQETGAAIQPPRSGIMLWWPKQKSPGSAHTPGSSSS